MAGKRGKARTDGGGTGEDAPSDPPLTRERIVATAVDLLDAEGIGGLTMRRLADRLGAGVMSLYWHVENKDDVLALALDTVLAYRPPASTDVPADWRGQVVHLLEDWRVAMLRHPWAATLLPRQPLGRNALDRLERLSRTLSEAGVADDDLNAAIWSLWNSVMGATVTRASYDRSAEDRAAAQRRLEDPSGQHPTIERSRLLLDDDWDGVFRRGIGFLLDGLSRRPR
ncbi:TetR family transcriptional regulator [Aureimonas endophytica]|uniref:TetR family transcriptional regulator n=1 Tax=Aureimonas endophytica TaxID=2027858 RepID=A0A917E1X4_9HYPH|nr:TetR/AcrR family transcriptional regulator C-terminal domain-containing protein [Aureimonas endophytica]GGD94258.1 TetR family transcriptional regulator [Aureimonas endophytica]